MNTQIPIPKTRRASALMLMIWAVMIMSVTVGGVVEYIRQSVDEASTAGLQFRAQMLAEAGVGLALNPKAKNYKRMMGTDSGFWMVKSREASRIPINYITDERLREAVVQLFQLWGLNNGDATTAVDSLSDWVDTDNTPRAQGAEEDYYKGLGFYNLPHQSGFTSIEEMLLVRGMDAVARAKPDWRDYFSLYSDGTVDLFWASKDVIMAVTGASDSDAQHLITARAGNDGIDGTEDDNRGLGIGPALGMLGIQADRMAAVQALTTYGKDNVFRIISKGWVGLKSSTVTLIARMGDDGALTYLARFEE
ncbi:MAG: exported protein of unknown function [Verrucomicrobiaceae bacterium]|nr:exported protein of unknown function [Verrucomicrobiaceae bacterium]